MSIIDDIQLSEVLYFLTERMMRQAKDLTKVVFKEHGFEVTLDQWLILKRISEKPSIAQIDIANSTFKDPAAVTRILDILERKQLVERQANVLDRRTYELHLTDKGFKLVAQITPVVQDIRAQGMKDLSPAEIETTKTVMRKMYQNLSY
ncbi:MAG: MarR family transcriptional regulator [Phaeodactylibacter sp.]|nr:MarR family transcriptional regulator [Phaeodactylibacter sp.]